MVPGFDLSGRCLEKPTAVRQQQRAAGVAGALAPQESRVLRLRIRNLLRGLTLIRSGARRFAQRDGSSGPELDFELHCDPD